MTRHLSGHLPSLVSYTRLVEQMLRALVPLTCYLHSRRDPCNGIDFIDSTPLAVCHNRRIHQHKVFDGVAARGKTSMCWFFGFKLLLTVNDRGDLLAFRLTPGNVDDRKPVPAMAQMAKDLFGSSSATRATSRSGNMKSFGQKASN